MRWWHVLFPPLIETHEGLFRPSSLARNLAAPLFAFALCLRMFFWSQAIGQTNYVVLLFAAMTAWISIRRWLDWREFGAQGRPLVQISQTSVLLTVPKYFAEGQREIPLTEIKVLVIKGEAARGNYVFERHEGYPVQVQTSFGRFDARVADFLQRKMPAAIPVQVLKSSNFFGAARGD